MLPLEEVPDDVMCAHNNNNNYLHGYSALLSIYLYVSLLVINILLLLLSGFGLVAFLISCFCFLHLPCIDQ